MAFRKTRFLYPIDWPQIARDVKDRAGWCCEICGRRHKTKIWQLPNGRWREFYIGGDQMPEWMDDRGRRCREPTWEEMTKVELRWVIVAAAHRDHDPSNCKRTNLICVCGRHHLFMDRDQHRILRRYAFRRKKALGDLFEPAPYPRW